MKPLEPFTEAQIEEFLKEFSGSNDRVLVIALVSLLDSTLAELVRLRLLASRERKDELFESNRPLGSFAAKIDLAYRMGLTDEAFTVVLHCLRNIRNKYAHLVTPGKLSSGAQGKYLREAETAFRKADAIWWGDLTDDGFLFKGMSFHLFTKLAIGIDPSRTEKFPIQLKPSNKEVEFYRLLAGKISQ